MSEEYDPFAEAVDFDELEEEEEEEVKEDIKKKDDDAIIEEEVFLRNKKEATAAVAASCPSIDNGSKITRSKNENEDNKQSWNGVLTEQCENKNKIVSKDGVTTHTPTKRSICELRSASSEVKHSKMLKGSSKTLLCDDKLTHSEAEGENGANGSKACRLPETDDEKWLWKSGWQYVRKFLKPYLNKGQISCQKDLDRLSKKLAQKVFEKELALGTFEINTGNARKVKKYVEAFFNKHKKYESVS